MRVVLHPRHQFGVPEALEVVPGIELLRPQDVNGVKACLRDGAEILVTYDWDADFLTPDLRWIAGLGTGTDGFQLDRIASSDIALTIAADTHASTVAEHAFALLLAITRGIDQSVRLNCEARWSKVVGEELAGKRMAIIGLGRIGEQIALRAKNWAIEIAGIKRQPDNYSGCVPDVRGPDALASLCEWADILMISAPANENGRPLIGARELELLGAGWLVNVGRGSLVDPEALHAAVTRGVLRGAGLDVTLPEPLPPDSPLWASSKVLITAHCAGESSSFGRRWGQVFRANLDALYGRGPWINRLVPPE